VSVVARSSKPIPKSLWDPPIWRLQERYHYFTDLNGYDGSAPNGTVYRLERQDIRFQHGNYWFERHRLSADEKTLMSHNVSPQTRRRLSTAVEEVVLVVKAEKSRSSHVR
jgi:hypothetical protein